MKKVTMFVWNHFTNDARVMREGLALSNNGYEVNLLAIENKNDRRAGKYEKVNKNFSVERVPMYPWLLEVYQKNRKQFIISVAGATMVIAPALFYISWLLLSSYFIGLLVLYTSVRSPSIRGNIIKLVRSMKMIGRGYFHNADIYHSNDLNTLTQGVICSKMRFNRKPLVYDSHEVQTDRTGYNPEIAMKVEKFLLKFVDQTLVENHTRATFHEKLYNYYPTPLYNYSDTYDINAVEGKDIHHLLEIPRDKKILLYQGGLQMGRGLEQLVEMMKSIEEGVLVFIGDGKLKPYLETRVNEESLQDKVKFIPKVYLKDLPSYTKSAYLGFQVLQNTSFNHYSASSNKLFEYMMAHVPVVGCDFPEIKRVIEEEDIGVSIDASQVGNITQAVQSLLENEEKRNELSRNCATAKHKYNWQSEQQKLLDIYEKL
ncbi:glycosyltransferase [Salinicoccus bachuensis]|uniref:Glycosyltransferase n=1 Tax=Salinicoccus bachuensis TaxID=3136731 RepID=A0ABZ3CJK1_9STAP